MSAPRDDVSGKVKRTVKRPLARERRAGKVYDPLHERIALIQRLCEEYEQWSRLATDQGKSSPYVAKILALLKETLRDTEGLLERLGLLRPQPISPPVSIDLSIIRQQIGKPDELVEFLERISRELVGLAVPAHPEDAGQLQSKESGEGEGSGPDEELLQRGAPELATGEDPRILPGGDPH
jgi:hypothetical protein